MKLECPGKPPEGADEADGVDTARFTLEQAPLAGQTFNATFSVCPNPCCPCGWVGLKCRLEPASDQLLNFGLDVFEHRLNTRVGSSPAGIDLGRAFIAEAEDSHWEWLGNLFLSAKRRQMETMDLDQIDAQLPPDVSAENGTMLGYAEIFPWVDTITFTHEATEWFVDDQYCIRPGCKCTLAGLSFLPVRNRTSTSPQRLRPSLFLHYDYRTVEFTVVDVRSRCPDPKSLLQTLRASNPDLDRKLDRRHQQLKQLGRRLLRPLSPHALGPDEPTSRVQPVVRPPKPGRNDPCPCGSGKKYKKCCGAN
jgi:hypothetical protein